MGILLLISGILLCLHDFVWDQMKFLIAIARFIAGCCYGFAYVTTTVQIGDNNWKTIRGHTGAIIPATTLVALLVPSAFKQICSEHSDHRVFDPFTLTYLTWLILLILAWNWKSDFEAVTWYLKSNRIDEAKAMYTKGCYPIVHPKEIQAELDEKALMLSEEKCELHSSTIFSHGNWRPLVLMICLRLLSIWTFNLFLLAVTGSIIDKKIAFFMQAILIYLRLTSMLPVRICLDKFGRRWLLLISGIGCEIFSIPLALHILGNRDLPLEMIQICCYLIHAFASFGIEPVTHIYTIEAFALTKRNASVAFVACIEYFGHGLIMFLWLNAYFFPLNFMLIMMPFFVLLSTIILFVKLPETKGKSLRECRNAFNGFYTKELNQVQI